MTVHTAQCALLIKATIYGKVKIKAQYLISAHRHMMIHYIVHKARTPLPTLILLLIPLNKTVDFKVCSTEVRLAYYQSTELPQRLVFIKN